VPVLDSDDVHTLSARILEQEHSAYYEAIGLILSGELEVVDRRVLRKRARSEAKSSEGS
jgi:phosphoribosylglycinamide formyltransferase-1